MNETGLTTGLPADNFPGPVPEDRVTYSIRGCAQCGKETRAYRTIAGKDYCADCEQQVKDLDMFHKLVGSGEP